MKTTKSGYFSSVEWKSSWMIVIGVAAAVIIAAATTVHFKNERRK